MRNIGVLVLINQYMGEPVLIELQYVRMLLEEGQAMQQKIAKVSGVQDHQPVLILGVDLAQLAASQVTRIAAGNLLRG